MIKFLARLLPPEGKTFDVEIEAENTPLAFTYIRQYYPEHHILRLNEVVKIRCPYLGEQLILA